MNDKKLALLIVVGFVFTTASMFAAGYWYNTQVNKPYCVEPAPVRKKYDFYV